MGNLLLKSGKVQIHQLINDHVGNPFLDNFFKYITHIGDGLFAIFIAVGFLFFNVRKASYVLLSYITASILTTLLKRVFFISTFRPHFVFHYFVGEKLNLVDGVDMLCTNSFPSGHATTAFALFFSLLFMSKNHFLKIFFFLLAFLAAYSRTYLSQHWLIDIYVGSAIGFSFSLLFYLIFYGRKKSEKLAMPLNHLILKNKGHV